MGRQREAGHPLGVEGVFAHLTDAFLGHGRAAGVNEDSYTWLRGAIESV